MVNPYVSMALERCPCRRLNGTMACLLSAVKTLQETPKCFHVLLFFRNTTTITIFIVLNFFLHNMP